MQTTLHDSPVTLIFWCQRKSCMAYRIARIPVTLSEHEGHFSCYYCQNASRSPSASAELLVRVNWSSWTTFIIAYVSKPIILHFSNLRLPPNVGGPIVYLSLQLKSWGPVPSGLDDSCGYVWRNVGLAINLVASSTPEASVLDKRSLLSSSMTWYRLIGNIALCLGK